MDRLSPAPPSSPPDSDSRYSMPTSYVIPPRHSIISGPQAYYAAGPSQSDKMSTKQSVAITSSLNGFADFLVQFNNNTVKAMEMRSQKFETDLKATIRSSILENLSQYETRAMDYVLRNLKDAMVESTRRVFSTEAFGKDDGAPQAAVNAWLGLGERLEDVKRQTAENGISLNKLQAIVNSVDERLSKLESSRTSALATINNNQPSSSTSFSSDFSNHSVLTAIAGQVEELGCMFDQLSKRVDGARDEAHQDKEELAQLFDETHKNLTLGLHAELRALKNAVGVGKGCLRGLKSDQLSSSLAERLENLAMDYQETMEYFKDAEATHEDNSYLKLKQGLEELIDLAQASAKTEKVTRDAGVMTDAIEEVTAEKRDSNRSDIQRKVLADATVQTDCSSTVLLADNLDVYSIGDAQDAIQRPLSLEPQIRQLQDVFGNLIATFHMPQARPRFNSPSGGALSLDTNLQKVSNQPPPGIQARVDPATSLLSPPSSAPAFRSMGATLKRKAYAADIQQDGEDAELGPGNTRALHTVVDDGYDFDVGGPSSPIFAEDRTPVFDLDRSPSPLTPLTSEDDLNSSIEGNEEDDNASQVGAANTLSVNLSGSLPSVSGKVSSETSDGCEPVSKAKTIDPLASHSPISWTHECPNKCGRSYAHRRDLRRHLHEGLGGCVTPRERYWCSNGCGRSYADKQGMRRHLKKCLRTENTDVSVSAKRRKVAQEKDKTPAQNSSNTKRGTLRKSNGSGGKYVHSREILNKCKWPPKTMINETFDHQLLQCDRCDSYYHYRCIGVTERDERLTLEGAFICPPCVYINDPQPPLKNSKVSCCGRPDCDWPGEARDNDNDYFIVERLLGRSVQLNANGERSRGRERSYLWLVKWHGYDIKECTWQEQSTLSNADELIKKFYASVRGEGMGIVEDYPLYLLREARTKLQLATKKKWKWAS